MMSKQNWERVRTGTYGVYRRKSDNPHWPWRIAGAIIFLLIVYASGYFNS